MLWLVLLSTAIATDDAYTVLSFSRKINTCDERDLPIENTTSKIIWAYNDQNPGSNGNVHMHTNMGAKSVRFFTQVLSNSSLPADAEYVDLTVGGSTQISFDNPNQLPGSNYWCSVQTIGNGMLSTKKQMIRVEPVVDPRYVKQVHHILLYVCQHALPASLRNYSHSCFDGALPHAVRTCLGGRLMAAWAVGGTPFDFPADAGMPFGPIDLMDMVMEIHYENTDNVTMYDNSGFRVWFTSTLREHDAGAVLYGHDVDPQFVIPPGQEKYSYEAWIPEQCTSQYPPEGIRVLALSLHTHVLGRSISLQQFRNGTEIAPLLAEPHYDFNYQDYTEYLGQDVRIMPGDWLRLQCDYNSQARTANTPMGLSTREEMCLFYFIYYPLLDLPNFSYAQYPDERGKTVVCLRDGAPITNLVVPTFEPYVPPPCPYVAPDPSRMTPTLRNTTIDASLYQLSTYLDPAEKIKLFWSIDRVNMILHAAIQARTTGWVGFGISPFGMVGADVLMVWVDHNQTIHFADRFALMTAEPPVDPLQDYYDVTAGQIMVFSSTSAPSTSTSTFNLTIVHITVAIGVVVLVGLGVLVGCLYKKRAKTRQHFNKLEEEVQIP